MADEIVRKQRAEYRVLIDRLIEARKTTTTPARQAMYEARIQSHRKSVVASCDEIIRVASTIKVSDTNEEAEKAITDAVRKGLMLEREAFAAWWEGTVSQFQKDVRRTEAIREAVLANARNEMQKNPLVLSGLFEEVAREVAGWEVVTWDNEAGCVTFP